MLKHSQLLSLVILTGLNTLSCRGPSKVGTHPSPTSLRSSSLLFVQQTKLLEAGGASVGKGAGAFEPSTFPKRDFWPSTPLVVPARAAAYINETYGATGGFSYQSFAFTGTGCDAGSAFARYFAAMEELRGAPINQSEKDLIKEAFQGSFMGADGNTPVVGICLLYDLIACIADYSIHNQTVFKQAAQSGDFTVILTGALSCIAEITGIDPTATTDPFDPSTSISDE